MPVPRGRGARDGDTGSHPPRGRGTVQDAAIRGATSKIHSTAGPTKAGSRVTASTRAAPRGGTARATHPRRRPAAARDAWHALLLAAAGLLAWNPYLVLDAGFQLSFAAVLSIFLVAPRIRRVLDGYPLPRWVRTGVAVSCRLRPLGTATGVLAPVPPDPAADRAGERGGRAGGRADARAGAPSRCSLPWRARSRSCSRRRTAGARRISPGARDSSAAFREPRSARPKRPPYSAWASSVRPVFRRPSGSPDPLAAGGRRARVGVSVGRLCLASWPTS